LQERDLGTVRGSDRVTLLLNPTSKSKFFSLTQKHTHTLFGICREKRRKRQRKTEKRVYESGEKEREKVVIGRF